MAVKFYDRGDPNKLFDYMPKGWGPILFMVAFIVGLIAFGEENVFVVFGLPFAIMLGFTPASGWQHFKEIAFLHTPTLKSKIVAVASVIGGGISGYLIYLFFVAQGTTVLTFLSAETMLAMTPAMTVVFYCVVGFFEEFFTIWFAQITANNLYGRMKEEDLFMIGLVIGSIFWGLLHIIALGFQIPAYAYIFFLGFVLMRIPGWLIAKGIDMPFYQAYWGIASHVSYDCCFVLYLMAILP